MTNKRTFHKRRGKRIRRTTRKFKMMGGGGTVLDIRKCLADYNETVDTYIAGNAPELYKRVYEYLSSNDKTVVDNYFKLKHYLNKEENNYV